MTKIKTIGSGTRVRTSPNKDVSNNILTSVGANYIFNGTVSDDGEWYQIPVFVHYSVVTVLPEPVPPPDNAIPYRSQWDSDASSRGADCGQTCVAMLAEWMGVKVEVDDLRFQSSSNGLSTGADLVKNFSSIGIASEWDYIGNNVNPPVNSICLVKYSGFNRSSVQDKNYYGWHWVVYLGENESGVTVNDPDWWGQLRSQGERKVYSHAEWNSAFIPSGSAGRVIVTVL